jgi:hypothetical protein
MQATKPFRFVFSGTGHRAPADNDLTNSGTGIEEICYSPVFPMRILVVEGRQNRIIRGKWSQTERICG